MSRKYLNCAETAKLLRQALKESFPGVKFSVNSKTYSGGASINVRWMNGPTGEMVKAISSRFEGAYFDGMIDYKGSCYHLLDGQPASFGADFIFLNRDYSDGAIIDEVKLQALKWGVGQLSDDMPELSQYTTAYNKGELWKVRRSNMGNFSLQELVAQGLSETSFFAPSRVEASATLARVAFQGDDGYGQGTVGMPGSSGGEQCYKAIAANQERIATERAAMRQFEEALQ